MPKRPLEILNFAAIFLLSVLTIALAGAGRLPVWPSILLRFTLMSAFLLAISAAARREKELRRPIRFLVNFYPMALIPMIYESLGLLIPALRGPSKDVWLVWADRALFGTDPTVWLERAIWPPLTDLLFIAYSTYYFFPIIVGAALWRRDRRLARRFIFSLSLAFYISYAGYFLIPARGPRVALADRQTVPVESTRISKTISKTLNELEHTKDDAFPSGHTMITVFCLITAYQQVRKLFWAWLPVGSLLVFSTVYCRFHYVVDVVAGLLLAFFAVPAGKKVYSWLQSLYPEPAGG